VQRTAIPAARDLFFRYSGIGARPSTGLTLGLNGTGHIDIIAGGYADWEAKRKQKPAGKSEKPNAERAAPAPPKPKSTKLSYKDQRDYDLLPRRIEELDALMARDEAALADPDLYTRDPARFAALNASLEKARAEKEAAEERWLELAEMVEG